MGTLETRVAYLERRCGGRVYVVVEGDEPIMVDGIAAEQWQREHPHEQLVVFRMVYDDD